MISYKPLLTTLVDKEMTKTKLRESVGFSKSTLTKISKNEYVSMEIIDKICQYLDCPIEDVVKIIPN